MNQAKILIIGINGFSGKHFYNFIQSKFESSAIIGFDRQDSCEVLSSNYYHGDLTDFKYINDLISNTKPTYIINLAGSFTNKFKIDYENNVTGTKNIFDSLIQNKLMDTKVLIIGTSGEYGMCSEDQSIPENHVHNPLNYYALTKVYQDHLALMYFNIYGLNISIARTFNIIGPGLSTNLFIGRFIENIQSYLAKNTSEIQLGNLESYRDYIDIRDVAKIYYFLLVEGTKGSIYNVGSGKSIKIGDIVDYTLTRLDIPHDVIRSIKTNAKLDISYQKADIAKIKAEFNLSPQYTWQESIDHILATSLNK